MRLAALLAGLWLMAAACVESEIQDLVTTLPPAPIPTTTAAEPASTMTTARSVTTSSEVSLDLGEGIVVVDDRPVHPWSWSDEWGIPRDDFIPWGIDLDPDGHPVIGYFVGIQAGTDAPMSFHPEDVVEAVDSHEGEVRLARCRDTDCRTGFDVRVMPFDALGPKWSAEFVLTDRGAPAFMWSTQFVVCADAACSAWHSHSVQHGEPLSLVGGEVAALVFEGEIATVEAAGSASEQGTRGLHLLTCTDESCNDTEVTTLQEGAVNSVRADTDDLGRLRVVYSYFGAPGDGLVQEVRVATCEDLACSTAAEVMTIGQGFGPVLGASLSGCTVLYEGPDVGRLSIASSDQFHCSAPDIVETMVFENWAKGDDADLLNVPWELEVAVGSSGWPTIAWAEWDSEAETFIVNITSCRDPACVGHETLRTDVGIWGMRDEGLILEMTSAGLPLIAYDEAGGNGDTAYLGLIVCAEPDCSNLNSR